MCSIDKIVVQIQSEHSKECYVSVIRTGAQPWGGKNPLSDPGGPAPSWIFGLSKKTFLNPKMIENIVQIR